MRGAKTAEAPAAAPTAVPAPLDPELAEALNAPPLPQYDVSLSLEAQPLDDLNREAAVEPMPRKDGFSVQTASLFFGSSSLGDTLGNMERWQPGEEPMIVMPGALDPDMKIVASLPVNPVESARGRRKRRQQG